MRAIFISMEAGGNVRSTKKATYAAAASCVVTNASTGRINCHLCNKCRASLSGVRCKERFPSVNMPLHARANGMWRGPDPVELLWWVQKVLDLDWWS